MALTLDIPVRTSITLPDNWQDCQTPQQLSYWLIARFDELAKTHDINDLKTMVAEVRTYVDTYDERLKALDYTDVSLGEDITALEQSISGLRTTLATLENSLSDIETNTNNITSINGQIDLVHEANIINAQKISALESSDSTQSKLIKNNSESLNTLDRRMTTLNNTVTTLSQTVESVAESVAGFDDCEIFDVSTNNNIVELTNPKTRNYFINCTDNVGDISIVNNFSEDPPEGVPLRFFVCNHHRTSTDGAIKVNISNWYSELTEFDLYDPFQTFVSAIASVIQGGDFMPNPLWPDAKFSVFDITPKEPLLNISMSISFAKV